MSHYHKHDEDGVYSLNLNKVPLSYASVNTEQEKQYIAANYDKWEKVAKKNDINEVSLESKNEFGDTVNEIPTPVPHPLHNHCFICK